MGIKAIAPKKIGQADPTQALPKEQQVSKTAPQVKKGNEDGFFSRAFFYLYSLPCRIGGSDTTQKKPALPTVNSQTKDVKLLPLEKSGKNKYPLPHSVFANTVQEDTTLTVRTFVAAGYYSQYDFTDRDVTFKYLDSIQNYSNSSFVGKRFEYGKSAINVLADKIKGGGKSKSIEHYLVEISKKADDLNHVPVYALSEKSTLDDANRDFEVVVATLGDEKDSIYSAYVLEHVIRKTYGNKVKNFKILRFPTKAQAEEALKDSGKSCREEGRKLYNFWIGHSGYVPTAEGQIAYQDGVKSEDYTKQGSRIYVPKFQDRYDENELKTFLNRNLLDVETIHYFYGCHSGAAVR